MPRRPIPLTSVGAVPVCAGRSSGASRARDLSDLDAGYSVGARVVKIRCTGREFSPLAALYPRALPTCAGVVRAEAPLDTRADVSSRALIGHATNVATVVVGCPAPPRRTQTARLCGVCATACRAVCVEAGQRTMRSGGGRSCERTKHLGRGDGARRAEGEFGWCRRGDRGVPLRAAGGLRSAGWWAVPRR